MSEGEAQAEMPGLDCYEPVFFCRNWTIPVTTLCGTKSPNPCRPPSVPKPPLAPYRARRPVRRRRALRRSKGASIGSEAAPLARSAHRDARLLEGGEEILLAQVHVRNRLNLRRRHLVLDQADLRGNLLHRRVAEPCARRALRRTLRAAPLWCVCALDLPERLPQGQKLSRLLCGHSVGRAFQL